MERQIYLAGPISGLTYEQAALGWRQEIISMLPDHWRCFSPMRGKAFLDGKGPLQGAYTDSPLASIQGILGRDRNDVRECDLMIACFLEADGNMSLGTAMEFGWADVWRKPVIMIADENDPHRQHPMLAGASVYLTDSLSKGAELAKVLLQPGV